MVVDFIYILVYVPNMFNITRIILSRYLEKSHEERVLDTEQEDYVVISTIK
jgi:hypothetical protein